VTLSQRQGKRLKLRAKSKLSPGLEKCCLRLCAEGSYEKAEQNIQTILGMNVGHSNMHRLVGVVKLPENQESRLVETASIDGGNVRVRNAQTGKGEWRNYKAIRLHGGACAAFFQDPEALQRWGNRQPLSPIFTTLGDGHDGVWNTAALFGSEQVFIRRQVLDWYHLIENLYKVGGSLKRLATVETLLWLGQVELALAEFEGLQRAQAGRFQSYLRKHRERIPNYSQYQQMGIPIGSGSVESTIKQIGTRLKITGAIWKPENVPAILRLRCAYLDNNPCLRISA
jgi:hypothetical protein